ncbi:DUF3290 family protein [Vagococcus salmoninarum]|uniref:DUF3290 family protein n=1 Tax=Vagococcus salmoninarum TaxID=2739 RepID=UPI003F98274B
MSFYTYNYWGNQTHLNPFFKYVIILVLLLSILFLGFQYLRHRFEAKYRDLIILLLLAVIFFIGIQYTDYTQSKNSVSQSSQVVNFLDSLSRSEKVAKEELRVNQGTLNENLIVEIRDKYYKVIFNNNFTAYELKEINLINPEIVIIDK